MVRVCKVEIQNFRSIRLLTWQPSPGLNCLIGPGDSGKTTILDAIDLCLGARRNVSFSDTDFFGLDVTQPISITLTLGSLPDPLRAMDAYGNYLQAFNSVTGLVQEEPQFGLETVLCLRLRVDSELEPNWTLVSLRGEALGQERNLAWKDRLLIAPARLGTYASSNLSWARGSVLNRLTEERPNLGAELSNAARQARTSFGGQAAVQLAATLDVVTQKANELGVPVGGRTQALLDAHAVSIGDGAIALHNSAGVPLRSLGTGSSRLLVAGMQRAAAQRASVALVDEVEYGLEPHRLTRLLNSLGARETPPPLQVFLTTHSPVAVRELNGNQLFVVRGHPTAPHLVLPVGIADDIQSTVRADPEAFLARSVIVCEGASEVGLIRGLDHYWTALNGNSMLSAGTAFVNVGGGEPDRCFVRGLALRRLGYRVLVLVDADKPPTPATVEAFQAAGGEHITWRAGRALEDELFMSLPDAGVDALLQRGIELMEEELVAAHIQTQSNGQVTLAQIRQQRRLNGTPCYAHLIVDEYQDCNLVQHALVTALSTVLPACVLGDPMQAIFGFRGNQLVDWDTHVLAHFPLIGELNHPWRWANAGSPELGRWLLDCRRMLLNGNAIDLRQVPAGVTWVPLQAETAVQQRLTAALTRAVTANGQVLVIGNSYDTRGRQQMASQIPGATTVEAVDLVDLTDFGAAFNLEAADALTRLVQFAADVMTQVGPAALLPRLETLRRGRARNPPTVAEAALVAFAERPGFMLAAEALRLLTRQDNARVYRPEVLRCCLRALQSAAAGGCTFADATVNERERNRHESRPLARRVIGSTLLLKGLEGEVAVITSPEEMDARHLYVAMTRGSSRLVVCSLTPILAAR